MAVAITRTELDAAGLRAVAGRSRDAAAARRMLALALVLEGESRADAARAAGMDRQTLRDWVHRYNAEGLDGLENRPERGRPERRLTPEQEAVVGEWVRQGPILAEHKVIRWRLVDLRDEIDRKFGVRFHERSIGKLMARLNFSRVSVRPEQDAAAQEAHKKTSSTWSPRRSQNMPAASRSSCGGRTRLGSGSKAA